MGLFVNPLSNLITKSMIKVFISMAALACVNAPAHADLIGLRVFREGLYGSATPVDGPLWIYRVYAEFDQPTNSVTGWGIGGLFGSGEIRNINIAGNPGGGFNNVPDDSSGDLAPYHPLSVRDWDTYMTVGLFYGSLGFGAVDATTVMPGSPTFIQHGDPGWSGTFGGAALSNVFAPQGRAEFIQFNNDTDKRVLLMQLVVNAGEHVDGTIGMFWRTPTGGFTSTGLTFSSIPNAGTLVIFASTLLRRRNRR